MAESIVAERKLKDSFSRAEDFHFEHQLQNFEHQHQRASSEQNLEHSIDDNNKLINSNNVENLV